MLPHHQHDNSTINAKHHNSEPLVYQAKNIARVMQQRIEKKKFQTGENYKKIDNA